MHYVDELSGCKRAHTRSKGRGKQRSTSYYTERKEGLNLILFGESTACNETESSRRISDRVTIITDSLMWSVIPPWASVSLQAC